MSAEDQSIDGRNTSKAPLVHCRCERPRQRGRCAEPVGDEHYRKVAQLMRTREIVLPPTRSAIVDLLRQSRRTRGESLFSKLPPGVGYDSLGSMHKSLWD